MRAAVAAALLLAGCSEQAADPDNAAGLALENAAVAAGVVRDPKAAEIAGLYARDTDQLCVVATEGGGYRIGASVDYGDQGCSATGTVRRDGGRLRVAFDKAAGCSFDAEIDGDHIVFPASLPAGCDTLCTNRASLAALEVDLLSQAASEAAAVRDYRNRPICRS